VASKTLVVFEEDIQLQKVVTQESVSVYDEKSSNVVTIYAPGPKGDKGEQGPPGYSGAGEPFFVITQGSMYATTASIAIKAFISSSVLPYEDGWFSLGDYNKRWDSLYLSESLFIITDNGSSATITGTYIKYNNTKVLQAVNESQQVFLISSGSHTGSAVNNDGVFIIGNFGYTPPPVIGGLLKSGSDFYIGV
jgi:hypothetical protein